METAAPVVGATANKDEYQLSDDARYTPKYQTLYKKRKETIERTFADAEEKHAMRYTQYKCSAVKQHLLWRVDQAVFQKEER